ncbi:MAG: SGNH/GDSL hydrolase family protein [Myxococcaceae bacterium]|nr:SGNH/GDSL hydrolase family protein [Myxococcaceae bacterium]
MANPSHRIFFGHQSVGDNLLAGVKTAAPSLKIVETRDAIDGPGLYHTKVGKNEAPLTKLEDFERVMETLGPKVDVALVKLCYIDFNAATDANGVFAAYEGTLERLEKKFPAVTFVRVTAPLTTVQGGAKALLKRALGKPLAGQAENAKRHAFNQMLRTAAAKNGKKLFDVAKLESERPDGTTELDPSGTPAMVPSYSDDGGHLSAAAQAKLGKAFYEALSAL